MYQRRLLAQTTRLSRFIPQRTLLVRCYAQDVVRDPMTGELSTLPDIDVRLYSYYFRIVRSLPEQ